MLLNFVKWIRGIIYERNYSDIFILVRGRDLKVIEGARVEVDGILKETDDSGRVHFRGLKNGNYVCTIDNIVGYFSKSVIIEVGGSEECKDEDGNIVIILGRW